MLRYYQQDALDSVLFGWEEYDRILLHLGTGGGKTVIAAHLIEALQPHRCLFLADQDELCQQPLTVIQRETGLIPVLEKANKRANLNGKVFVASSQTLSKKKRLERFPPGFFKYAIIDEAHRGADRDQQIIDYLGCKALGITATPFKANVRDLSKYYNHVPFSMPMLDLIGEGFAPPIKVQTIPIEIDLEDVETKRGFDGKDYDAESLSTTIAPYYEKIIEHLAEHADRFMLVRLPLIKSSEAFAAMARKAGISAVHVDGTSPDRDQIIEGFRRGQFHMLCNANLIEVGVDIPNADCAVNLAPTRSPAKYQQFIGRITRVLPGVIDDIPDREQAEWRKTMIAKSDKPDALIIDFLWQHDQLGVMNPSSLVAVNEEDARIMYERIKKQRTPEELMEIAQRSLEERETALVEKLENAAQKSTAKVIEPEMFGMLIGSKTLMDYDPIQVGPPPTEAQLTKLRSWHINTDNLIDRQHATHLMGFMLHRFKYRLATVGQLMALKRLKLDVDPQRLSMKEASRLISETKLRKIRERADIPF